TSAQVAAFEKYIGHPLPTEYREFLFQYNGGHPDPDAFLLDNGSAAQEDIVLCFFPMLDLGLGPIECEEIEELRTWPLHCAWDDLQSDLENVYEMELEEPLLPVGTDGSSNYFCVVLAGNRAGSVVFLDHEMAESTLLGGSFNAFLASLRPRERTDYAF
ncbi:MAG TPA: SMI1/KNR4 family protein, partial [Gemmataceae bacterium]|nr:SMI1/KNR4 family protein [Gemmataceae bacterium]